MIFFYHEIPACPQWKFYQETIISNWANCYGRYRIRSLHYEYRPRVGTQNDISIIHFSTSDISMLEASGMIGSDGHLLRYPNSHILRSFKNCQTSPAWLSTNILTAHDRKIHPATTNWDPNTNLGFEDPDQTATELARSVAGVFCMYGIAPDQTAGDTFRIQSIGDLYQVWDLEMLDFGTLVINATGGEGGLLARRAARAEEVKAKLIDSVIEQLEKKHAKKKPLSVDGDDYDDYTPVYRDSLRDDPRFIVKTPLEKDVGLLSQPGLLGLSDSDLQVGFRSGSRASQKSVEKKSSSLK